MTTLQKQLLYDYQAKVAALRADEISSRVREKLSLDNKSKINVTPMLKLKVIDANVPDRTATLSIWKPSESVVEMLKERSTIEVINASASGIRYNEIQLSAGKYTMFKNVDLKLISPRVESLLRRTIPLAEINKPEFKPNFNEIDTAGLVVHIGEHVHKKFQPVYIVDDKRNLLCINFWNGLKSYAYEDLVTIGRTLFVRDLQWRTVSTSNIIPCSFATEFTTFTENPKSAQSIESILELRKRLQEPSLSGYIDECVTHIDKCNSNRSALENRTPVNLRQSMSIQTPNEFSPGVGLPESTVQRRIDKLSRYGQPPPISPLTYNKCHPATRNAFKIPQMNDDTLNASTSSNKI